MAGAAGSRSQRRSVRERLVLRLPVDAACSACADREKGLELACGKRAGEVKALPEPAAEPLELRGLRRTSDAFCDDLEVERMRQIDDRSDEGGGARSGGGGGGRGGGGWGGGGRLPEERGGADSARFARPVNGSWTAW